MNPAIAQQPLPIKNENTPIAYKVSEDLVNIFSLTEYKEVAKLAGKEILQRAEIGKEKYGTYLQANNGRDAIIDAYQELLDCAQYLQQKIEEIYPDFDNKITLAYHQTIQLIVKIRSLIK